MTVRIRDFNSDFTRFLDEKIRHTVKIVTKTEVIECSGAILSQHSEVMKRMVEEDEEIFLDNYNFVKECLAILHGGIVELSEENCEEIIKFGIQFYLHNVIDQGLEFLASKVSVNNVKNSAKICWSAKKFAAFCDLNTNIDYFWPLEDIMNELSITELDEFATDISSTFGIGAILEMITNGILAKKLLNSVTSIIDQSNVDEILGKFPTMQHYDYHNTYVEAFSDCPKEDVLTFLEKIEASELLTKQWKIFKNLKKCVLRESIIRDLNLVPDANVLLKSWKQFSEEKILQVFKVIRTDFYVLEIMMSWVALTKPDLKTVRYLCSLVDTTELEKDYMEHVMEVFKNEGYVVSFDLNSKLRNTYDIFKSSSFLSIAYTKENVDRRVIRFRRIIPHLRRIVIGIDIEVNSAGTLACKEGKVERLYGRTREGKQIPFYTDISRALRDDMVYDPSSLCAFVTITNK